MLYMYDDALFFCWSSVIIIIIIIIIILNKIVLKLWISKKVSHLVGF